MATDAAKQGLSHKDVRTAIAGNGQPSGHETPKVPALGWIRCPGPAGTWACALEFGHADDHERFAPEPVTPLKDLVGELSAAIRNLRQERNELLLTCAELVDALRECREFVAGWGYDAPSPDANMPTLAKLDAAIKRAESK